ncbi:TetR/AcrR family transcriptional regulator [Streptomyces millisiae]|uniref:TetR family transcriptional regulator n=1 Tax=Streptomyces millisiae TaxID=3075542 RepID=A0ABU2LQ07_9ACTN|nr:TetR family transcriptional regulator [Streptomyces sp. DSM 44918]MDT0319689.1 TetR family transcriptional regulator [Streptomyces sp. DSM 44918]
MSHATGGATRADQLTPGARRILAVASELFYRRGIHAVGVDTIAAESGVTKRTLYDRFGSKDGLLVAYLETRDQRWRDLIAERLDAAKGDAARRVLVPFEVLPEWLGDSDRGCSFINAFAELPEPEHPGRQVIVAEKKWLRDLFHHELTAAGATDPDRLAVQLLSLHEGAIVSFAIVGETDAAATVHAAARALLAEAMR